MGNPSPRYTAEFKQKAVEPYGKSGTTYAEVARGPGCGAGSLSDWVGKADVSVPAPDANPFQMAEDLRRLKRENERLKRENRILLKASALFVSGQLQGPRRRGQIRVHLLQRAQLACVGDVRRAESDAPGPPRLEIAAAERPRHARRRIVELISQVGEKVRNIYGAPKTFMWPRAPGVRASRKRAARIVRERGRRGVTRTCAKRPSGEKRASRREPPDDLVERRFESGGPDAARFADITYVKIHRGRLYTALVVDICSRRIAGWSMGPNITAELADETLKMALAGRSPPEGCIHYSDHGSRYASPLLSRTMRETGIRPSMGSILSPRDNAAMESTTGIVKPECAHARTYAAREGTALDPLEHIEVVYNSARIHSALGHLSPAEFEEADWPKENSHPKAA